MKFIDTKFLMKPYPYTGNIMSSLKTILFISVFVSLFVFIFTSESLFNDPNFYKRARVSFYFGLITFFGASINMLIIQFIVNHKMEKNWKVWNEILIYLIHLLTISTLIFYFKLRLTETVLTSSLSSFFQSIFVTILIGIIPITIDIIYKERTRYKKHFELASGLTPQLEERSTQENKEILNLGKENIGIDEFLYAISNRNYVDFILTRDKIISLRMTIISLENKLENHPSLIRCHRAYIVNSDKIERVEGNAQGLRLYLFGHNNFVPVSRSYIPKLGDSIRPRS